MPNIVNLMFCLTFNKSFFFNIYQLSLNLSFPLLNCSMLFLAILHRHIGFWDKPAIFARIFWVTFNPDCPVPPDYNVRQQRVTLYAGSEAYHRQPGSIDTFAWSFECRYIRR